MAEDVIFKYIEEERERQMRGLELIASENFVSQNLVSWNLTLDSTACVGLRGCGSGSGPRRW